MERQPAMASKWSHSSTAAVQDVLGPLPGASLRALEDLGLTDAELVRYLHVAPAELAQIRRCLARRSRVPAAGVQPRSRNAGETAERWAAEG